MGTSDATSIACIETYSTRIVQQSICLEYKLIKCLNSKLVTQLLNFLKEMKFAKHFFE